MAKIDDAILTLDELNISVETKDPKDVEEIDDGIYKRSFKEIPVKKVIRRKPVQDEDENGNSGMLAGDDGNGQIPVSENIVPGQAEEIEEVEVEDREQKTSFLTEQDHEDPVLRDVTTGEMYPITTNPFSIGKLPSNDLVIDDKVISRHHAEIVQFGDKIFIRDLKSLNGTFVGGYRVPPETDFELKPGQQIVFSNKKYSIKW